ncbi:protein of unknown function [Micropruina glycogenica]|uniref:Uncharacterized protein n=1 Tax=Micropruina glycogenica TaxID=75385 RepID=A0A2N9JHE9_9ACTN|nr:protein of unknown function [Micropruina glycogenica]
MNQSAKAARQSWLLRHPTVCASRWSWRKLHRADQPSDPTRQQTASAVTHSAQADISALASRAHCSHGQQAEDRAGDRRRSDRGRGGVRRLVSRLQQRDSITSATGQTS